MRRLLAPLFLISVILAGGNADAQSACASDVRSRVLTALPGSQQIVPISRDELKKLFRDLKSAAGPQNDAGHFACVKAEILKRLGDPDADDQYKQAIQADPANAEFRLLYGDYLRNYRGPGRPLIDQAATQYYAGLGTADVAVANQIRRSLIALYERDGVALDASIDRERPSLLFSTQNVIAHSPDDLGAVDTIRTLTSAALFAESASRLHRSLTNAEAAELVRDVGRSQTLDRLRARYRTLAFDVSFEGHRAAQAQVTNFFQPASANDVSIGLAGVAVEEVTSLSPLFDVMVRGDFKAGTRAGLIEFQPDADESVRSLNGQAVLSRFVGPDKINVEFGISHDRFTQRVATPIDRGADIVGATVRYQFYRPLLGSLPYERPIAARGSEIFGGVASSTETFGAVDVSRHDVFFGVAFKGLPGGGEHSFDVTVQPTVFTSHNLDRASSTGVEFDPNDHLETFATVLYRIVDRENVRNIDELSPLAFLNVVGLASIGRTSTGPVFFERTRVGGQVDAKLIGRQRGGMTWLVSGRYELQTFSTLGQRYHVVFASVNLGF